MRSRAGERPVLTASAGTPDRAGVEHVATVRRGPHTMARLWSEPVDEDGLTARIVAELPDWRTARLEHRRVLDEVQVRLRSVGDERVLARASARCVDRVECWTLDLGEGRVWELQVPLRRRPTRLAVRQAGRATPWRIEVCRRPSGWALSGPPELGAASTVMCLWLVHLIDVGHVLHDRPWWAPPEWSVLDDTTGRLAPGGFTAVTGGGGSSPGVGF